jgi:hypothetical protein
MRAAPLVLLLMGCPAADPTPVDDAPVDSVITDTTDTVDSDETDDTVADSDTVLPEDCVDAPPPEDVAILWPGFPLRSAGHKKNKPRGRSISFPLGSPQSKNRSINHL